MMERKLKILLIYLISLPVWAAPELLVDGNRRTATNYIKTIAKRCLRDKPEAKLDQCLLNTKLFAKVSVNQSGSTYKISIKERWTLIPIPIIGFGGEFPRYGLMVIETNAFGRGKMLMSGLTFGSDGHMAMMMFKDRAFLHSNFTIQLLGSLYKQDQYAYREKEKVYGYHQDRSSLFGGLGYLLTKDLEIALSLGYSHNDFKSLKNVSSLDLYEDIFLFGKIHYKGAQYKFYFNEGLEFRILSKHQLSRSDGSKQYWELETNLSYQKAIVGESAFQLGFQLGNSNLTDIRSSLERGQSNGFRGTERASLWMNRFVSLALDYQVPLYHFGAGTWTFAPFFDLTFYESVVDLDHGDIFHSFGVGTYFFLKQVAIPGMGLQLGYNSKFMKGFLSFSVGFAI